MPAYSPERAAAYAAYADRNRPVFSYALQMLKETRPAGKYVMDLGCGSGTYLARLGSEFNAAEVLGVDGSADMVVFARARALRAVTHARIRVVAGLSNALPLADGSYDIIFANHLLHCAEDLPGTLAEANRVLAPGGSLIATYHYCELASGFQGLAGEVVPLRLKSAAEMLADMPATSFDTSEAYIRTEEEYRLALAAAGFLTERDVFTTPSLVEVDPSYSYVDGVRIQEATLRARKGPPLG